MNAYVKMVLMCLVAMLVGVSWPAYADEGKSEEAKAEEAKDEKPAESDKEAESEERVRFRPPSRGAPESRIGGGVRGSGDEIVFIALVPRQLALTVSPSPALSWYLDRPVKSPLQISITRLDTYETVCEAMLPGPHSPGIAMLQLTKDQVVLEPRIQYEWTASLMVDDKNPSQNPVTGGWLTLIDESDELKAAITGKRPLEMVAAFAERGVWYDALATLNAAIQKKPDDAELRAVRRALLLDESVNLPDAAACDAPVQKKPGR